MLPGRRWLKLMSLVRAVLAFYEHQDPPGPCVRVRYVFFTKLGRGQTLRVLRGVSLGTQVHVPGHGGWVDVQVH